MKLKKIALDPGHGGSDPGAVSKKYQEKEVNLILASHLLINLIHSGYEPLLLRGGDLNKSLGTRVEEASSWQADFFLSLHHNGHSNPEARGTECFHFPGSPVGEMAATALQQEMVDLLKIPDRGVKNSSAFFVLRQTPMPAVLIEPLFLTSSLDRNVLICPNYFPMLSKSIIKALNSLNGKIAASYPA